MSVDIYIYTSKEKMFSHITYLPAFQPKTKQNVFGKIITHHIPKKQTCTSTYPSLQFIHCACCIPKLNNDQLLHSGNRTWLENPWVGFPPSNPRSKPPLTLDFPTHLFLFFLQIFPCFSYDSSYMGISMEFQDSNGFQLYQVLTYPPFQDPGMTIDLAAPWCSMAFRNEALHCFSPVKASRLRIDAWRCC